MHGAKLIGWDSNESIRHLALVCRNWEDSALFVLYRSVALLSASSTKSFLNIVRKRPHLGLRTTSLVLGLGKHREDASEEVEAHLEESLRLVEVLKLCPNLKHLQLRPLHGGVRPTLLEALRPLKLVSFAHVARYHGSEWIRGLLQPADLPLLLSPKLRQLELDFDSEDDFTSPSTSVGLPLSLITSLRLQTDFPVYTIIALLVSCASTLQKLEVYVETPIPYEMILSSLLPSHNSLTSLSLITNLPIPTLSSYPPPVTRPLMDDLLPHLPKLNHLRVSAHDISISAFSSLPPSLHQLCVHFVRRSSLTSPHAVMEAIQKLPKGSRLETLCVHDNFRWDVGEARQVRKVCKSKGVRFKLSDSVDCSLCSAASCV